MIRSLLSTAHVHEIEEAFPLRETVGEVSQVSVLFQKTAFGAAFAQSFDVGVTAHDDVDVTFVDI